MKDISKIHIVLASKSPRRAELIKYITDSCEILPPSCDETLPEGIPTAEVPELLAVRKALSVVKERPESLVIGCDTVVVLDDVIFGKPHTKENAERMLLALSGRTHLVISGVCLCYKGKTLSFSQETSVCFYPISREDILRYIDDCSPLDKAGSYGIQDRGALFVREIHGDYLNVVGMPVSRISRELSRLIKLAEG